MKQCNTLTIFAIILYHLFNSWANIAPCHFERSEASPKPRGVRGKKSRCKRTVSFPTPSCHCEEEKNDDEAIPFHKKLRCNSRDCFAPLAMTQ
jgi:hypothetical protein